MSHYYEDFSPGVVHESRGRTLTETDIVNFAGLQAILWSCTPTRNSRASPVRTAHRHGALVFSISTG